MSFRSTSPHTTPTRQFSALFWKQNLLPSTTLH